MFGISPRRLSDSRYWRFNPLPTDNGRGAMFGISLLRFSDSRYWTFNPLLTESGLALAVSATAVIGHLGIGSSLQPRAAYGHSAVMR